MRLASLTTFKAYMPLGSSTHDRAHTSDHVCSTSAQQHEIERLAAENTPVQISNLWNPQSRQAVYKK